MENEMTAVSLDDRFKFSCSKNVPCFNECCKDLSQILTPYDILRLKNSLGISSGDFLEQYTLRQTGPESGLPVIIFKTDMSAELKCPFVTPSGCSVYEDRPSSCRTYPLARVVSRSRETGILSEQYVLLKETHCLGFEQDHTQTVREWIKDQGIEIYNEMNDMMMEIIALKNRLRPGPLDIKTSHIFHMACYDLDAFRTHVFEKGIFESISTETSYTEETVKDDDTALLKLGLAWIKQILSSA
ncbi:MAG: YkgJ family cysteine cluster protein [Desulfobacteraceae bacterium]|nr:YkgJ family cysteine cluster protein [Desulfobacteraceae bacterium]